MGHDDNGNKENGNLCAVLRIEGVRGGCGRKDVDVAFSFVPRGNNNGMAKDGWMERQA